jgi:hypothetical protein
MYLYIEAWFRKVCGDFHKLSSSVREIVGEQDLGAVSEFGRIARQRVAHQNGPSEFRYTVFEHIAQIFARMLAAAKVQRDPAPLMVDTRPEGTPRCDRRMPLTAQ